MSKKIDLTSWKSTFTMLAVILIVKSMFFNWYTIPSGSMIPTLSIGDYVLVNKNAYNLTLPFTEKSLSHHASPEKGDVVVFNERQTGTVFIKRVVATGGDTIVLNNHNVYINGKILAKTKTKEDRDFIYYKETDGGKSYNVRYAKKIDAMFNNARPADTALMSLRFGTWVVPNGTVFLMGDNRDNSEDSRFLKQHFINNSQVFGKAISIPFGLRKVPSFSKTLFIMPVIPKTNLYI